MYQCRSAYLSLQILRVVVGGVLGVHLLFPHFAHEDANIREVQRNPKSQVLSPLWMS